MLAMHIHDIIRKHIYETLGLIDVTPIPSLPDLRKTELSLTFEELVLRIKPQYDSQEFFELMRNRLILGAFRYGLLGDPNKKKRNRVRDIKKRWYLYIEAGNLEHLVDAANLSLLEYEEGENCRSLDLEHLLFYTYLVAPRSLRAATNHFNLRVKEYESTGFSVHLAVVAYMCLREFNLKRHPNTHFEASDDTVHTEE